MIENKTNSNLIKLALMIVITLCIHVLTLVKSSVVAAAFGTSESVDAYNFANSIVTFVFGIVISGISTIIIPEYSNKRERKIVDSFITVIYGATLIITAMMVLLRYPLINLLSNKGEAFTSIAANCLVILMISQYLSAVSGITTAYFQCENKHNVPKVVNLLCQLLVIAVLLCVQDRMSILEYALIISAGYMLGFVADTAVALKSGWRFSPALRLDSDSKAVLLRFVPIIFSGGVYRLSLLIDSLIASTLSTGMITILNYSIQISNIVSSVIVGNLLLYIYPRITREVSQSGSQERFWEQALGLHAIVCLMIAGYVCVGEEAVMFLLNRGRFSAEACKIVFYASALYITGQGISIIRDMVYRYFYAIGNTKAPAGNSVLVSVCNITISLILVKLIGFYGIILGTLAASVISLTVIMIKFHKFVGFSGRLPAIIRDFAKNFAVMLVTIVLVCGTKQLFNIDSNLLGILVFGMETVIAYILIQGVCNKNVLAGIRKL
ncbi:MAG: polysaccharide biosynthesis C-terminal domain-containing protein [Oscillospiraceae bacterium]|nr:polysaccharide biosynthesis C-terminal domain-containing protein [Oscillospiraceae bacterium]